MTVYRTLLLIALFSLAYPISAQNLYFPPVVGNEWETISPSELGWCQERIDSMYDLLEENNTKAFIILKDGKIVLEKYFGTFQQDSIWYWASAGKSLTSCLVGIAAQEGLLSLSDTTSRYLGKGWTACTPQQEDKITIRHQLTMTTGLDDKVPENYCTLDTCLLYKADAGTRWAYHNAPYTLLDGVIESATGQSLNAWFQQKVRLATGINGIFRPSGYNNVFYSKPRSMARFGLMILNRGNWNGTQVITDTSFFNAMVNTSQDLNQSYGYLWWLNGKASYMLPTLQIVFPGSLMPHAPDDMIAALGKNGQYINVVPSQNLVLIRMGNAPDGGEVPVTLNDKIWEYINVLDCGTTATSEQNPSSSTLDVYPNPARQFFTVRLAGQTFTISVYNTQGIEVFNKKGCFGTVDIEAAFAPGIYYLKAISDEGSVAIRSLLVTE
jgi:CubicO group peptidase (beta-lactamase class C family)